ncbi:hypothetical protein IWQ60_000743 [Tieghemiomyces parasiticus]|uniref:Micro-fibrillar-associated protein 1 C-terminal domain-containing protein n=1 Tax=Tieghemiomyces parasiticus TaxID=78921 RepID=A0A9W8ALS4_9FUNG|nr:hypothetical protein IWQ60_000743 [Tieghemiomyces parasiticus]
MSAPPPAPTTKPKPKVKRYWPGKIPEGARLHESDSSASEAEEAKDPAEAEWARGSESESDEEPLAEAALPITATPSRYPEVATPFTGKLHIPTDTGGWAEKLRPLPGEGGSPTGSWSYGEEDDDEEVMGITTITAGATNKTAPDVTTSGSESESNSDDDGVAPALLHKPVFKSKAERIRADPVEADPNYNSSFVAESEREERQKVARQLVEDRIKAEHLEVAAAATTATEAEQLAEADDTDGLDPAGELAEWREREEARLQRTIEEREARDKELREVERRRNLTDAEREREDEGYHREQRKLKEERRRTGQNVRSQGAFYTEEHGELLRQVAAATSEARNDGTITSAREDLPEFMRVKNYGRASQSKWKSLAHADTTRQDSLWHEAASSSNRHQEHSHDRQSHSHRRRDDEDDGHYRSHSRREDFDKPSYRPRRDR